MDTVNMEKWGGGGRGDEFLNHDEITTQISSFLA